MSSRLWLTLLLAETILLVYLVVHPAQACCPAPPRGQPVVNADQTVIMIWDAATKTQHFIRQASFKSDAEDFGFLVPSPTQPELAESGDSAFAQFRKLTEPERKKVHGSSGSVGCGCGTNVKRTMVAGSAAPVRVLEEKMVAGFHAVVLETKSTTALADWLKDNDYAFSPEVQAWAKPYVEAGWKITALRVKKRQDDKEAKEVSAKSLRMTFKTDRPLFPYREPEAGKSAEVLGAKHRLLRIYFVAEARYRGELTPETPWTGRVAWAGKVSPTDRANALELLKLPETTGPAQWWLTEFEDDWAYRTAPADVTFSRSPTQDEVRREPIIEYVAAPFPTDGMVYALAAVVVVPPLVRRRKRGVSL
ncbi:MAG TPA: DUF2330 domain-containing protein [Gemmataceae bacterium]|nr:DUF2330 domain-containing protein [Gemmataceae bacterium]